MTFEKFVAHLQEKLPNHPDFSSFIRNVEKRHSASAIVHLSRQTSGKEIELLKNFLLQKSSEYQLDDEERMLSLHVDQIGKKVHLSRILREVMHADGKRKPRL